MSESDRPHPDTVLAQALHLVDPATGAIVPAVHAATTYARDQDYALRAEGVGYARDKNPAYRQAERVLAALEAGADALLFSSGQAAARALLDTLAPGAHVVAPTVMYHGLRDWLQHAAARGEISLDSYDAANADALAAAVRAGETRLVWVETPANPTWTVTDIAQAARIAHAAGARLAVDSTVATPLLTRPIELGADFVFHSATKYLNGHSDVVAGVLVAARDDEQWQAVRFQRLHAGPILGAFETWLLLRGMRTLHLRLARACASAMAIATHFERDARLERVLYPGLAAHPGHALAVRQMRGGFGGMLSLLVRGDAARARAVATRTRILLPATSLGGVESLIEHRASVEPPGSPIPQNLLRVSVGIEDAGDLIADLDQALG